mgnify:CR=1 FL=1
MGGFEKLCPAAAKGSDALSLMNFNSVCGLFCCSTVNLIFYWSSKSFSVLFSFSPQLVLNYCSMSVWTLYPICWFACWGIGGLVLYAAHWSYNSSLVCLSGCTVVEKGPGFSSFKSTKYCCFDVPGRICKAFCTPNSILWCPCHEGILVLSWWNGETVQFLAWHCPAPPTNCIVDRWSWESYTG